MEVPLYLGFKLRVRRVPDLDGASAIYETLRRIRAHEPEDWRLNDCAHFFWKGPMVVRVQPVPNYN